MQIHSYMPQYNIHVHYLRKESIEKLAKLKRRYPRPGIQEVTLFQELKVRRARGVIGHDHVNDVLFDSLP